MKKGIVVYRQLVGHRPAVCTVIETPAGFDPAIDDVDKYLNHHAEKYLDEFLKTHPEYTPDSVFTQIVEIVIGP